MEERSLKTFTLQGVGLLSQSHYIFTINGEEGDWAEKKKLHLRIGKMKRKIEQPQQKAARIARSQSRLGPFRERNNQADPQAGAPQMDPTLKCPYFADKRNILDQMFLKNGG